MPKESMKKWIPARLAPQVAKLQVARKWSNDAYRQAAEAEMRFLLEHTERAGEIEALARPYAEHMVLRSIQRWRPESITHQEVRGIEWLTTKRDQSRGAVVSFLHHNRYEAVWPSMTRASDVVFRVVATPDIVDAQPGTAIYQHKTTAEGTAVGIRAAFGITSTDGEGMVEALMQGHLLGLAQDFPGNTEVTWLGRRVLCGSGAPRLAIQTNSPVILLTIEREGGRPYIQLHEPLEPSDFADYKALLNEILRRHEPAVLAWPEAVDGPTLRFGVPADA
jgi:lauroyl/myristoyl acyltransferase